MTMTLDVLWHDLECSGYREDLALWHTLAGVAGGPVLDIGAGTGRVSLDLAAPGIPVVVLDARAFAPGPPVPADPRADADAAAARRPGRARRVLRRALDHLEPGGLLAAAVADAVDCFDAEHELPPPPDACEIDGVRYASQLVGVDDEGDRAAIRRRREIIGPAEHYEASDVVSASSACPPARSPLRRAASASPGQVSCP